MKNDRNKAAPSQFLPLSIARMLWNTRLLIVATWLTVTAGAYFVIRSLPAVYEAEAMVLVDSQKIPEKYVASTVQVSLQDSLNAINQRVLAGAKLLAIIRDFHLYENEWNKRSPEELMDRFRTKDLTFTLERGLGGTRPNAFRVTFQGGSPKEVAGVVNRITDLFIHENATVREGRAVGTADFIQSQLAQAKQRLDQQEAAVTRYKTQYSGELPEQASTIAAALAGLRTQLQGNQDSLNRVQQNITVLDNTLRFAESSLQTALRVQAASAARLAGQGGKPALKSDSLRQQLAQLRSRYTDDHPDVKRLAEELDGTLALEAKATAAAVAQQQNAPPSADDATQANADVNQHRERVFNAQTQLEAAKREIKTLTAEREQLVLQIANYQARLETMPVREQQFAALLRDYDMSKVNYQQLLDRKFSAGIATAMEKSDESERFVVTDPAREPSKPVRPKRSVYIAGASLGALLFGLLLGLTLQLKRNTLLGEWEVPAGIPILGRIPEIGGVTT
jgi:polysaccharide chain length determinant protein (PEP-CTERM system associated)